jgi:hypothetical protein
VGLYEVAADGCRTLMDSMLVVLAMWHEDLESLQISPTLLISSLATSSHALLLAPLR